MEEGRVRSRVGVLGKKSDKVNRKVLKWCGHVKSMNGERLTIGYYESEQEGRK